jgi:hypothetical protein
VVASSLDQTGLEQVVLDMIISLGNGGTRS